MRIVHAQEFLSDSFAERWTTLLRTVPSHDLGQTYAWNRYWWHFFEKYGSGEKQLLILVDEKNNQLTGIWPLFVRHHYGLRTLHWIGQAEGMITDYMQPLINFHNREEGIRCFFHWLAENSRLWDILDIRIPKWSNFFQSLTKGAAAYGARAGLAWKGNINDYSTAITLPDTFEKYLASIGAKTRSHLKQYLRASERADARLEIVRGSQMEQALADLYRLNSERWSVFSSDNSRAFLRHVVRSATESMWLCRLRKDDETLACALCYQNDSTCFVHSAGVMRQSVSGFSPGTAMYGMLISFLIQAKLQTLDFSPGLEEYKLRLGAVVDPTYRFTLWMRESSQRHQAVLNLFRSAKQNARYYVKIAKNAFSASGKIASARSAVIDN